MTAGVVQIAPTSPGVVQITMQDRSSGNALSPGIVAGLLRAFESAGSDEHTRVVVLTGYDSYFCSGGTREALLQLQQGSGTFADTNIYRSPMDCPIPVIAAMQGHGIGGGLVLGLFADCVVMSRESVYAANFMKYGFTPGMGATYVVPNKLGVALANEMLLSARSYRGADLEKRGAQIPIVNRPQVLGCAHELARLLAEKPRVALVALKQQLVAAARRELPDVVAREVAMHRLTFGQPGVRERIDNLFGS